MIDYEKYNQSYITCASKDSKEIVPFSLNRPKNVPVNDHGQVLSEERPALIPVPSSIHSQSSSYQNVYVSLEAEILSFSLPV